MNDSKATYKQAGVDLDLGDKGSEILYNASRATWVNRKGKIGAVEEEFAGFFSMRLVDFSALPPGTVGGHNQDGVGTKIEVAERVGRHDTVAHDLLAMVCDDAAVRGAEPMLAGSTLSVNRIDVDVIRQLAVGLIDAAALAGVAVTNGELAELGNRIGGYGPYCYNWEGTVFWLAQRERLCRYDRVKPGCAIVAIRERGFRSNGLSLVRKVFQKKHGAEWHKVAFEQSSLGEAVLAPSIIYSAFLVDLTGGVTGVPKCEDAVFAHVTGGGIPGKLGRVLSLTGCGAELHDLHPPPPIMAHCQLEGGIEDEEAYRAWNMGNGLLCLSPTPDRILDAAKAHKLEARIAGEVIRDPVIRIRSSDQAAARKELKFLLR